MRQVYALPCGPGLEHICLHLAQSHLILALLLERLMDGSLYNAVVSLVFGLGEPQEIHGSAPLSTIFDLIASMVSTISLGRRGLGLRPYRVLP